MSWLRPLEGVGEDAHCSGVQPTRDEVWIWGLARGVSDGGLFLVGPSVLPAGCCTNVKCSVRFNTEDNVCWSRNEWDLGGGAGRLQQQARSEGGLPEVGAPVRAAATLRKPELRETPVVVMLCIFSPDGLPHEEQTPHV